MFVSDVCRLTTKDYTILEIMREQSLGNDDLMRSIASRKLSNAIVMLRDQIPSTVVTVGSRVRYRIDDGPSETRIIAGDDYHGLVGLLPVMPISHPHGLAMLGLAEGASVVLRPHDGPAEKITVLEVANRRDAARRGHGGNGIMVKRVRKKAVRLSEHPETSERAPFEAVQI
jgi:regulator of nucleoside diphosphate kinase